MPTADSQPRARIPIHLTAFTHAGLGGSGTGTMALPLLALLSLVLVCQGEQSLMPPNELKRKWGVLGCRGGEMHGKDA